ncbi:low molecular weight phosphatase family protein [Agreia sp. PsM10]|uniref:arsenate reductase/protein-tyrosine-phosphatase family protein n=1 Tax=Agreia sp. PsM10 TaxID=3030533 RepID=UPI00263B022A|nr:low molecular weight phosphatase family protein [Agreia sp. PsM10]MDN4641992.1 low molecular weight phosphatase family protein [Agreia sp. PsM10]
MPTTNHQSRPFTIVAVCTGNICRSPLAAQLLQARFDDTGLAASFDVESAGLSAVVGAPMDQIPAEISERLGGDPGAHAGRQLTSMTAEGADLILTMTRAQRDEVVRDFPRLLRRAFTVSEFVQLLAMDPRHSPDAVEADSSTAVWRAKVKEFSRIRSRVVLTGRDDIADPYRQSREIHETVGEQISLAMSHIAHSMAGLAITVLSE